MQSPKNKKIIVIVGPTASGKSELAVKTAKKIGGEIISADSRQVYEGLDVGTAKVKGKWIKRKLKTKNGKRKTFDCFIYKRIPHYCIDFISPTKTYSAGEFKKCAEGVIKNIFSRGKVPIIVGGTGFWVDTVIYNINFPEVAPDFKLRRSLEKKSPAKLYKILKKLDPKRAGTIEKKNPRRLIRAIEIAKKLGGIPPLQKQKSPYNVEWVGLNPPFSALEKNITERAHRMVNHGLLEEVRRLLKGGVSKKKIREFGFEYKNALNYLEGHITKKEMLAKLILDTLRYAKQQMRWFKRNKEIRWYYDAKKFIVNLTSN